MGVDSGVSGKRTPQEASTDDELARAIIQQALPSALYRAVLEDGSKVLAHVGERSGKNFLRLLPGDRVRIRLSPNDSGRGRIVDRDEDGLRR